MEPDFSGYATKAGLKCTDGRTITAQAFQHMDGQEVPLVWQHGHKDIKNVLGHVKLEAREDGLYCHGYFNETPQGQTARAMVQHKDINSLSIWANQLVEKAKTVLHGALREVSLVLAGANPGAKIDYVRIAHSDDPEDYDTSDDEAIIYSGLELVHSDTSDEVVEHATYKDIYDTLNEEQTDLFKYMLAQALEQGSAKHSDVSDDSTETDPGDAGEDNNIEHQEGTDGMTGRNVFDQSKTDNGGTTVGDTHLSHDAIRGIFEDAKKVGFKAALKHAMEEAHLEHGINDLELLFPDFKATDGTPQWNKRRTEWVANVLNGVSKTPFTRIKTIWADITQDEARAKGYITGSYKKEEWFGLSRRTTGPTTVYKKQKLDRDEILDVTEMDLVAWLWGEIRLMLEEEVAVAILIGDGRDIADEDKILDPGNLSNGDGIRSILHENEMFATTVYVNLADADSNYNEVVEALMRARKYYKGTGGPTFYTTSDVLVEMMLTKDDFGNYRYPSREALAAKLGVTSIVEVEPMEREADLIGIIVNLADYNVGTDRGGEFTKFEDFDIDYNQYKYLLETRLSGALRKIKSAMVVKRTSGTNVLVSPTTPTFNKTTGVVTIPSKTGVVYKNADTNATLTAGAQSALAAGATLNVLALPASGYYFATSEGDMWSFKRPAAA